MMARRYLFLAVAVAVAQPLFAAAGPALSRADVERVVGHVVQSFARMNREVLDQDTRKDYWDWGPYVNVAERFRAADVSESHVAIVWGPSENATAHLALRAVGTRLGGGNGPFPAHWTIGVAEEGGRAVITSVVPDETVLAKEILYASTDAERLCLLDSRPDLDRRNVIKALQEELGAPAKSPEAALLFVFEWARQHRDAEIEARCPIYESTRALMADSLPLAVGLAEVGVDRAEAYADPDMVSLAFFKLGIAEWRSGLLDRAVRHLRTSADLVRSLREPTIALKSEYMYAIVLETRGASREAIESAQRLRRTSHEVGWQQGEMLADWVVANEQMQLRNFDVAREYHRRIFERCERNVDAMQGTMALGHLGIDEMELGNLSVARDLLTQARRRMGGWYWSIQLSAALSRVLVQLGKFDEAEKVLDSAEWIGTPDPAMRSDTELARSDLRYAEKRFGEAADHARKAILTALLPGRIEMFTSIWPAQTTLARSFFALGRLDEAETAFRDAIATVEAELGAASTDDIGRVRIYEDKAAPYRGLAELLEARGEGADALAVAEAIRARALREMMEQGKINLDAALTAEERTEKQRLEREVTERTRASIRADANPSARRDLDHARLELEDFNAQVAVQHGRAFTGAVARPEDILAPGTIRSNEIAVEYLVGERQTLAFLVTRRGGKPRVNVRKLPIGARRLSAIVRRLAKSLQQRDLRWESASRAVYDAVVRPIAPNLASFSHICVIPDGDLWSVPFDVLRDERGVMMIEKATISYSPSLLMLRDTRRSRPRMGSHTLFAMANPTIDAGTTALVRSIERDARLGALPEAEHEVERLRELYGSERSEVHVGAEARESLFKAEAGRYQILHIATHGMVDDRSPMYSCLVLAPDAQDDGLLEMREIVGLDLHADVAVLSSCETARGRIERGEGLVGIAWAFLAAGCPTTVVSQWKVDSAATERLMVDFHRRLIRSELAEKAEALRRAKLSLMKESRYRHPFYWAPFIVIGNP